MLMTLQEASKVLKVSKSSLYHWGTMGLLPCVRVGRQIRFEDADIVEHFKSGAFEKTRQAHQAAIEQTAGKLADKIAGGR